MPQIGTPFIATSVDITPADHLFMEGYLFLPQINKLIFRRTIVRYKSDSVPKDYISTDRFEDEIFNQIKVDYELYLNDTYREIYRGAFIAHDLWDDYLDDEPALLRFRLAGKFQSELPKFLKTSQCIAFKNHLTAVMHFQPLLIKDLSIDQK